MTAAVKKEFETLCDKEFQLARRQAYENLDREIADIKEKFAHTGNLKSSSMAQAVADAILARFDKVLGAFEAAYLGKFRNSSGEFSELEYEWLKAKVQSVLDEEVGQVSATCNGNLWDASLTFARYWQQAEIEARKKKVEMLEKIDILRLQKAQEGLLEVPTILFAPDPERIIPDWDLLHPAVVRAARSRFESRHFADAVEAALKDLNDAVKKIVKDRTGKEYDGADLMNQALSPRNPIIQLDDLSTVTGRDVQLGYMQIFAGAMTGIRNPKAHSNIEIDEKRAMHFLFLVSLLFFKIDEALS